MTGARQLKNGEIRMDWYTFLNTKPESVIQHLEKRARESK